MYTITMNGSVLYHPTEERLMIASGILTQSANTADTFEFSLYPDHPHYALIQKLNTTVELFDNNIRIFRGRVLNRTFDLQNRQTIVCEGVLAYFADTIVHPYEFSGTVKEYLDALVYTHNEQVQDFRTFEVGRVDVSPEGDVETIYRYNSTYPTVLQEITTQLTDKLGGFLVITYRKSEDNPEREITVLNYLNLNPRQNFPEGLVPKSKQRIELGSNILDLKLSQSGEEFATAIIPLGATIDTSPPEELEPPVEESRRSGTRLKPLDLTLVKEPRVTIRSVTENGVDFVYNNEAEQKFGRIIKTVIFDDVTSPVDLWHKGNRELGKALNEVSYLEISAADLSQTDASIDDYRFLEYVDVFSAGNQIEGELLIVNLVTDILNPANSVLTVGSEHGLFSHSVIDNSQRIETIAVGGGTKSEVIDIFNRIISMRSSISQTASSILSTVASEYTTKNEAGQWIRESFETNFGQLDSSFEMTFSRMVEIVTKYQGDVQSQFSVRDSYIKFVDGTIILGVLGSPYRVEISNDRMSFFQDNHQVAYLSNDHLFVEDGKFLNSLKIGDFAFLPRTNGNLSFVRWT